VRAFAHTTHSLRLLEQCAVCVHQNEPLLLCGETGTGKCVGATVCPRGSWRARLLACAHSRPLFALPPLRRTSVIQHLADRLGQRLVVVNLSQQSESSDVLGGFRPVHVRHLLMPLKEEVSAVAVAVAAVAAAVAAVAVVAVATAAVAVAAAQLLIAAPPRPRAV
jgi:hypothetical protein